MANLYREQAQQSTYKDVRFEGSQEDWDALLNKSTTFYVGNLSFYTTEEQIYALFSKCGEIKRIIMGLDRVSKTPCGFCFVEYAPLPMHAERVFRSCSIVCATPRSLPLLVVTRRYYAREDAEACYKWVNGTRLDDRTIRVDWDIGFKELRQYGRGKSGGQVRPIASAMAAWGMRDGTAHFGARPLMVNLGVCVAPTGHWYRSVTNIERITIRAEAAMASKPRERYQGPVSFSPQLCA